MNFCHRLLVVIYERVPWTLWLRFRERMVSALNPKQSCRLVGWKHENLPVPASFWLTTANPLLNQSLCVCSATGFGSLFKQTGINPSRIAENKVSAQNTFFMCCNTGNEKKQIANTFWTVAPVMSNVSWDCLPACADLASQWSNLSPPCPVSARYYRFSKQRAAATTN